MAQDLYHRTLKSKAVETLGLHTECKLNQKELVFGVEKIRRKGIFITWFNLVHDEIPKLRKADDFYVRSKLNAIR